MRSFWKKLNQPQLLPRLGNCITVSRWWIISFPQTFLFAPSPCGHAPHNPASLGWALPFAAFGLHLGRGVWHVVTVIAVYCPIEPEIAPKDVPHPWNANKFWQGIWVKISLLLPLALTKSASVWDGLGHAWGRWELWALITWRAKYAVWEEKRRVMQEWQFGIGSWDKNLKGAGRKWSISELRYREMSSEKLSTKVPREWGFAPTWLEDTCGLTGPQN